MNAFNQNPYTSMLLTYNADRFYGRENEIISILQVITAPEPNGHAIYGIRTIGKTTLIKFLKDPDGALREYESFIHVDYRLGGKRRLLFVHSNFHNFGRDDSIFFIMLSQLDDELSEDEFASHTHITIGRYDQDTARHQLVDTLRRVLSELDKLYVRVVFLLDDFDAPLEFIDATDDGLLRTLSDLASLIIVTEDPIVDLRPDIIESSPLLGILRPEAIGLISEQSARLLMHEPARHTGIQFSEDEEDFLLNIAGRQPFLLTAACELYFGMRRDYPDITRRLEDKSDQTNLQTQILARLASMPHVDSVLHITWNRLDEEEQAVLTGLVLTNTDALSSERATLIARAANKGLAYWNMERNTYSVFSLLFSDFIRRTQINTNAVTVIRQPVQKSGSLLTDHLSPIDRALLQYFLDHPGEICSFDDILDAVWEDSEKSKRALEAAVHRLRKHLRTDQQIKNVRGKGYKFMAEKALTRA